MTGFYADVLIPAARIQGAAEPLIDHLPKNGTTSRYTRGSGAKLAATDVAVVIECLRPFHLSQSGTLKIKLTKDRRGYLHRRHDVRVEVNDDRTRLRFSRGADADPSADEGLPPAAAKVRVRLIALARPVNRPRSCTHRRGRSCLHGQPTRRRYSLEQCLQNHG